MLDESSLLWAQGFEFTGFFSLLARTKGSLGNLKGTLLRGSWDLVNRL